MSQVDDSQVKTKAEFFTAMRANLDAFEAGKINEREYDDRTKPLLRMMGKFILQARYNDAKELLGKLPS